MGGDGGAERRHGGPWGLAAASLSLLFLAYPVGQTLADSASDRVLVGYVALAVLIAAFIGIVGLVRRAGVLGGVDVPRTSGLGLLAVVLASCVVAVWGLGPSGLTTAVYAAAAGALVLRPTPAALYVPMLAVAVLVVALVRDDVDPPWVYPALVLAVGLFARGMMVILARNLQLESMRAQNDALLLTQERNRFAQELHDILGHSLTVVTVKAELANRLLDLDLERARHELQDLERLAREALADVRRAVHGYKDVSLGGELMRARRALESAGISADLPASTDHVVGELRELFAWTIREGVTNVIRHSKAERCTVRLHPDRVIISDDGVGPRAPIAEGVGISGLEERAARVGAVLLTRRVEPCGFELEVNGGVQ